jgi:CRP/FNR family transcriptional regulator, cyclic AMP receptor protein
MRHAMAISRSNHEKILKGIMFFSSLAEDDLTKVDQIIIEKKFKKNSLILLEEETKNYMYIVFSGKVKVVQTHTEGRVQILAIHKKGDFFGEMALLDGKTQPASVLALEDTTVGLIAKADFESLLLKNESMTKQIIFMLCKRLRESWLMLRVLSFADAEHRVRAVLTHVGTLYGISDLRGTVIPLKLTHKEIADYAALARETVSRMMVRFSRAGEIEILDNKNIIIKPKFVLKSAELAKYAVVKH